MPAARRYRLQDKNLRERNEECEKILQNKSHFNFIKLHLLVHYCSQVQKLDNIPIYSMDIGDLAHKVKIKKGYRHSNKNETTHQILQYYGWYMPFSWDCLHCEPWM